MVSILAVVSFVAIFGLILLLAWQCLFPYYDRIQARRGVLIGAVLLSSFVFLRPHEDAFIGLDTSAYRLMTDAFQSGRDFDTIDHVLLEAPEELRKWFLLRPDQIERDTRDHSFQLMDIHTGRTAPFFYPLLPLCMHGLDILIPGNVSDYFVPLCGVVFAVTLMMIGFYEKSWFGFLAACAFLFATSHPAWTFRGCFLEVVGGILCSLSILPWLLNKGLTRSHWSAYVAMGLSITFHPVMIVYAAILFTCMLVTEKPGIKRVLTCVALSVMGILPFVLMTLFVCQPYGGFDFQNISHNFQHSFAHRATMIGGMILGVLALAMLSTAKRWLPGVAQLAQYRISWILLVVLWVIPIVVLGYWPWFYEADLIKRGFIHWVWGMGPVYGAALILLLVMLVFKKMSRAGVVVTLVMAGLPLFCYLRAAEGMGVWSQRRFIIPYLVMSVSLFPVALEILPALRWSTRFRYAHIGGIVAMLCVTLYNPAKYDFSRSEWTGISPYYVQFEKGADDWVASTEVLLTNHLTVVEQYHISIPLAVTLNNRVLGLSEMSFNGLGPVVDWLSGRLDQESVLWLTENDPPPLENGILFEKVSDCPIRYDRVNAHSVFPAYKQQYFRDLKLYQLQSISEGMTLSQDKVLDGSWLGIRAPWGQRRPLSIPDVGDVPAMWTRQGSGFVGPVPGQGKRVRIELTGSASRSPDITQIIFIKAPWSNAPEGKMIFGSAVETKVIELDGPPNNMGSLTGVYQIYAEDPYNPAEDGLGGYAPDLGVLLNRIFITLIKQD